MKTTLWFRRSNTGWSTFAVGVVFLFTGVFLAVIDLPLALYALGTIGLIICGVGGVIVVLAHHISHLEQVSRNEIFIMDIVQQLDRLTEKERLSLLALLAHQALANDDSEIKLADEHDIVFAVLLPIERAKQLASAELALSMHGKIIWNE